MPTRKRCHYFYCECNSNGYNVYNELLPSATRLAGRSYIMVPGSQVICKMVNSTHWISTCSCQENITSFFIIINYSLKHFMVLLNKIFLRQFSYTVLWYIQDIFCPLWFAVDIWQLVKVNMAAESLIEGEDENILYDLLVITEWPPETETQVSSTHLVLSICLF